MPGSWPKNGLFIVRAENGKYWAETLSKDLLAIDLTEMDLITETSEMFDGYILPALRSLAEQVREHHKKELLEICGKVIRDKAQA